MIQADREAYADVRGIRDGELRSDIISGYYDVTNGPAYQILARHRLSSPVSGTDMVIVPREMTDEMASALAAELMRQSTWLGWEPTAMWAALLSASPSTPIPVIAEAGERERARQLWAKHLRTAPQGNGVAQTMLDNPSAQDERAIAAITEALSTPATLDNTAVEGLLDARPVVADVAFGPEPSLREMVRHYYGQHYHDEAEADRHTATYLAILTAKTEKA